VPELTRYAVEQWWKTMATGECHYTKTLDGEVKPSAYGKLRKIMFELCHAKMPVVESVGRRDGYYRPIQEMVQPLDFTLSDNKTGCPIILPFDLRKYVWIDYDNTIVFTGSKDSGKSGILYRTAMLNVGIMHIVILSNMEGGKSRIQRRFKAMGIDLATEERVSIFPVYENYHDYIKEENTIYIIDYIDVPEGDEFFRVPGLVKKIDQKIQGKNSVAVVGLQKPVSSDFAYGGQQTMKVTSLYVAVDISKLKIVSVKEPSEEMKKKNISPRNMQWTFTYSEEGTKFDNIQPCYGD